MATVQKSIRTRLYPTEEQEVLINKTIGCGRFVYNQTLENCIQSYEQTRHFPSKNERIKNLVQLKEENEFLKEVDARALQLYADNLKKWDCNIEDIVFKTRK